MPFKEVTLTDIGPVKLYKRKGARHIRLTITSSGEVRVTIPSWLPYRAGAEFALSRAAWIVRSRPGPLTLGSGQRIGMQHTLVIEQGGTRIRTRLTGGKIRVTVPAGTPADSPAVQTAASRACIRALKAEAETALPLRLQQLAERHGFRYRSVRIRQLKGRWGSCSHQADITLNCYLMQLSWELIDYVLLHELVHTRIMSHGPRFWKEMAGYIDNLPENRRTMGTRRPLLIAQSI